jgi:hypothetical protein
MKQELYPAQETMITPAVTIPLVIESDVHVTESLLETNDDKVRIFYHPSSK